ncbi:MAG: hypothetical protein ACJ77A_01925 [Actinomycetota bacterium]
MNEDVRDQRVRDALESAAGRGEPPEDRLLEQVLRRGRVRATERWVAIVAAVAVFVGGVTWAGLAITGHHHGPIPAAEALAARTSDPVVGLSMQYPASWHVQRFRNVCMIDVAGTMVANVPDPYRNPATPSGCRWPPGMGRLPATAVVVEFDRYFGGPQVEPSGSTTTPDTTFPLSLSLFGHRLPGPKRTRYSLQPVTLRGDHRYQVNVWIGRQASAADRALAAQVVSSIAPALCPEPSPGLYDPGIDPASGPAGSTITVSGEVPTVNEEGSYTGPSGIIAVWWNADSAHYADLLTGGRLDDLLAGRTPAPGPGDAVFLGMQNVDGRCSYALDLTVPAGTPPGTYDLTVVQAGEGSASALRGIPFTVTP